MGTPGARPRFFVPPGSCAHGRLVLDGAAAERLTARGVAPGDEVVVLDDSGWEMGVRLDVVTPATCAGELLDRHLAPERRTKVSLYHGLLHPSDFRRLLVSGTAVGVVAFVPVIADRSVIPPLGADQRPEGVAEWPRLVRDAAETAGRGRCPAVATPMLFDQALDEALRGGLVLVLAPHGQPLDEALVDRPFSIALLAPPPGGFSAAEVARARARAATVVAAAGAGPDPIQPALATLRTLYARLEGFPAGGGEA